MLDKVLALDNRTQREILARLTKEFALGKEEKRTDPTQKTSRSYTKGEFVAFYGQKEGERRWKEAGNKGTKKVVKKVCGALARVCCVLPSFFCTITPLLFSNKKNTSLSSHAGGEADRPRVSLPYRRRPPTHGKDCGENTRGREEKITVQQKKGWFFLTYMCAREMRH